MAGAAATATGVGLTTVLYGTLHADIPHTVGGSCITLAALAVLGLILIRQWIVDTSEERRLLGAAQREAQSQRSKYFAAQAALQVEQGRLSLDRAAQVRSDAARLLAEREALRAEFEDKRAALIAETMEATILMIRSGKAAPQPKPIVGNLIEFPRQHHQTTAEPERTREHGVVGP
jgi:hypothetical protein